MAVTTTAQAAPGVFVPTTNIWGDIHLIQSIDVQSDDFKELLVRLYQNVNNICLALNLKDSGYYVQQEFVTSQLFFAAANANQTDDLRPVFRMVVNFGALPNAGTTSVAHGINISSPYTFTRIYGASSNTDSTSFLPLPYSSPTLNKNIEVNIDDTNINITTAIDYSDYINTYIILEYIKQ